MVPRGLARNVVGCKWDFRVKFKPDGEIDRFKARLVAKGFHQRPGLDFTETFSSVIKPVTIRVVLTIVISCNWPIRQIDVNNAFLHGELKEEVYMKQPPSYVDTTFSSHVCRLKKSLYGLKQAPRVWYYSLHAFLTSLGFTQFLSDSSLFI